MPNKISELKISETILKIISQAPAIVVDINGAFGKTVVGVDRRRRRRSAGYVDCLRIIGRWTKIISTSMAATTGPESNHLGQISRWQAILSGPWWNSPSAWDAILRIDRLRYQCRNRKLGCFASFRAKNFRFASIRSKIWSNDFSTKNVSRVALYNALNR